MPFIHVSFNLKRIATYELGDEALSIGRTPNNDIVIDNPGVSSSHARIFKEGADYFIEDLDSKNGTYLKEARIGRHRLNFGDVITIFKHQLQYVAFVSEDTPMAERTIGGGMINQGATLVIDRSMLTGMGAEEQKVMLVEAGESGRTRTHTLNKYSYCIGKHADCLVKTSGFLAPAISARLIRQSSGYLLVSERKGEVKVNDAVIDEPWRLQNGDDIDIRKLRLIYMVENVSKNDGD